MDGWGPAIEMQLRPSVAVWDLDPKYIPQGQREVKHLWFTQLWCDTCNVWRKWNRLSLHSPHQQLKFGFTRVWICSGNQYLGTGLPGSHSQLLQPFSEFLSLRGKRRYSSNGDTPTIISTIQTYFLCQWRITTCRQGASYTSQQSRERARTLCLWQDWDFPTNHNKNILCQRTEARPPRLKGVYKQTISMPLLEYIWSQTMEP